MTVETEATFTSFLELVRASGLTDIDESQAVAARCVKSLNAGIKRVKISASKSGNKLPDIDTQTGIETRNNNTGNQPRPNLGGYPDPVRFAVRDILKRAGQWTVRNKQGVDELTAQIVDLVRDMFNDQGFEVKANKFGRYEERSGRRPDTYMEVWFSRWRLAPEARYHK